MKVIGPLIFAAALLGLSTAASAFGMCMEPQEAMCLRYKVGDWSERDFDLCRTEMKSYVDQLQRWQDCIVDEANDKAKSAVNRFNCYARRENFCI